MTVDSSKRESVVGEKCFEHDGQSSEFFSVTTSGFSKDVLATAEIKTALVSLQAAKNLRKKDYLSLEQGVVYHCLQKRS